MVKRQLFKIIWDIEALDHFKEIRVIRVRHTSREPLGY
jgi:hypothetical protein